MITNQTWCNTCIKIVTNQLEKGYMEGTIKRMSGFVHVGDKWEKGDPQCVRCGKKTDCALIRFETVEEDLNETGTT